MEKLINFITKNFSGNPRLVIIYVIDWVALFYYRYSNHNDFKILSFNDLPEFLVPTYNFIYDTNSILVLSAITLISAFIIWCKEKNAKAGFPIYVFLFYYLIDMWTCFFNFYVFSGKINLILNNTSEFILGILTLIALIFVVENIIDTYNNFN